MKRSKLTFNRLLVYLAVIGGSVVMAYPMLYTLLGSFASLRDLGASPVLPIPRHLDISNYEALFSQQLDTPRWVFNTLVRIVWYTVVPGSCAVLAGYVFARLRFRGREGTFIFLLSSMMVPGIVFWIPTYIMLARWPGAGGNNWLGQGGHGFVNEWGGLLIPNLVSVYFIFLFRQTFYGIPRDFEEAARVDGAGTLTVLTKVYLPMLKPTLTVVVIFEFIGRWNEYQWPLIISTGNPKLYTVALGAQRALLSGSSLKGYPSNVIDYPFAFALAVITVLPPVLVFLWLQRNFVEGMQGFAIKG